MKILAVIGVALVVSVTSCGKKDSPKVEDVNLPSGMSKLCGNRNIIGKKVDRIKSGSCGISAPVKVYAVNGVKLSTPATLNCGAAQTFAGWVQNSMQPAANKMGKRVSEINILGSYSCRTRNHKPGAKLSEHSYGNAIDVGGFTFTDGKKVTILKNYYSAPYKNFMTTIRKGACGPFGTVLGPGYNALHANHFHFDTARYSMGAFCK